MPTLLSSPLQGFTDYRFRNPHQKYFGGIDHYYAPYIRLNGKLEIKNSYQKDLDPKNNAVTVIPQVMTNDPNEFLFVVKYVQSLGYKHLNWNLGCPYPMVTNRGLGSGLICQPAKIDEVLAKAHGESDITISMKMRMGYEHNREILDVYPILAKYPLHHIAIHARIGKQLYQGAVDLDAFEYCYKEAPHTIYYNGDITSVQAFRHIQDRFPNIEHFLIGRGLLADPFVASMIKADSEAYPPERYEILYHYLNELQQAFAKDLSGDKHVIQKLYSYWEYLEASLPDTKNLLRKIKKSKSLHDYEDLVWQYFRG